MNGADIRPARKYQTEFPEFQERDVCEKCGHQRPGGFPVKYVGPFERDDGAKIPEHLLWRCTRCSYGWRTQVR